MLDRTDLDLYGEWVAPELVSRLRPTERFDSVDALVAQMHADVSACRSVLGHALVLDPDRQEARGGRRSGDEGRSAG